MIAPVVVGMLALLQFAQGRAATIQVEPQGEFASIDTTKAMAAIDALHRKDSKMLAAVQKDPGSYQPPVLYALAGELFRRGQKDEAMFWFYLGQLRARSDANKSEDPSAGGGVGLLNEAYGDPINQHAFKDIKKLKTTVARVAEADSTLSRDYDPRWISLHGMDAFASDRIRFAPKSKWESINKETRRSYLADFADVMKEIE